MKKITLLAILAIAAFSNNANAQSSATATATATIVTPIGITKTLGVDMSFGNVAVTGTAGTVTLSTAGARTAIDGVTLPSTSGTVSAASFDVSGTAGYTYTSTIPETITLTRNSGSETMTVTAINNSVGPTGKLDETSAKQNIKVGGTLNVAASQVAGVYKNDSALTVTVNYN
jgi:hypothetical protein